VRQPIRDYVGLLLSSAYVTRSATAEQGLANFLFRGAYTPGMDSTTFKLMRLQGAKVYPKFEDISAQDGIRWTDGERTERTARSVCEADSIHQLSKLVNKDTNSIVTPVRLRKLDNKVKGHRVPRLLRNR
jgi:hypothetical protein